MDAGMEVAAQPEEQRREVLKQYYAQLFDLLQDGMYVSDRQGWTLMVNTSYERLTGIKASEVVGRNVFDLRRNGLFNVIVNPDVVATGKVVTSIQEVNGRRVVLKGHPILGRTGEVELVVTFVRDVSHIDRLLREVASQRNLVESYQRQIASLDPEAVFQDGGMIAVSKPSIAVRELLDNIAPTDAAVLILGETGVGKDVVARRLQAKSLRADKVFLKVDCSAIPESLMESELFGYEAGAFSGARAKGKMGFFEKASGGTLFLDEVGELALPMQTKLLRAIQDQEIIRVGSTTVTPIDIRIIAATNKELEEEVKRGRFRSDLYYRLKVAVLRILPLRQRRDDILPLAKVYLQRFNQKYGKNLAFTNKAEKALLNYEWPGNVRELENAIHSVVVTTSRPVVTCGDLPAGMASRCSSLGGEPAVRCNGLGERSLKEMVRDFEQRLISEALEVYGSVAKAAEALGVNRCTLFRKANPPESSRAGAAGPGEGGGLNPGRVRPGRVQDARGRASSSALENTGPPAHT